MGRTSRMRRQHSRSRSRSRSRSCSRSPSPSAASARHSSRSSNNQSNQSNKREQLEEDRRQRMARLRAENKQEETKLNALHNTQHGMDHTTTQITTHKCEQIRIDDINDTHELEEDQIASLMGFGGFSSTKGKPVKDNQDGASKGAAAKGKARKYRQYMNRKGGFNRALDTMK